MIAPIRTCGPMRLLMRNYAVRAADELVHMTARINRGEAIPEPVKQLPVMGGRPLNRAQALAKIAEIKAKFGLKGASV